MFPAKTWCVIKVPTLFFLVALVALVFLPARITADDDHFNHRAIEVDRDFEIVGSFGEIATLGYNTKSVVPGGLNSPYDAKGIGDYTGLTPPFDNGHAADNC